MSLRIARKIARLTQRELAKRAGLDHSFISRLESGERRLRLCDYPSVVRLAVALDLEPDELFTIVEAPPVHIKPTALPVAASR
jgi:transcriptional regulator with XRE-family HTH domain